jgi:hypothetical protein
VHAQGLYRNIYALYWSFTYALQLFILRKPSLGIKIGREMKVNLYIQVLQKDIIPSIPMISERCYRRDIPPITAEALKVPMV